MKGHLGQVWAVRFTPQPPLRHVVRYTDWMRTAALAHLPDNADAPQLAGRRRDGTPPGQHRHTHWLPLIESLHTLAGVVAWCPDGWSTEELAALASVRRLHAANTDVTPTTVKWPEPATWWGTLTPYVPGRHGTNLAEDVRRECRYRGLPEPDRFHRLPDGGERWATQRPSRRYPRQPPTPVRAAIRFDSPVAAPLTLGRMAHFGLGYWWPLNPEILASRWGINP